jgi:type IV secretory pathway VirB4 component
VVAAHQATTRHLGAAYPFATEPGLGSEGVLVGRDLFGGAFVYDPFVLYRRGVLSNPNMVVFGQIGRGKSAFVKSYLWRQSVFGRRAWVVDPKGEYGPLAQAWGIEPLALHPGGHLRLNPLDAPGDGEESAEEVARRRGELLCSLAAAGLGRPLAPAERTAVELAVVEVSKRSGEPTLPLVVEALLSPTAEAAATVRTDREGLAADGRPVALELRRLVAGDLRGMFDGVTSPSVSLDGPVVVLDLSAVYHSAALGILMTCAAAWLQASLRTGADRGPVLLVVDEAWAILANLGVARWLQSSWKMSRAWGVANVAVLHRVSDLSAAGAAGSEQVSLSRGLLADSETRVIYGQPPSERAGAAALLGLSETEEELVARLGRGVALWKVGGRAFLVQHRLSPHERQLVDTDARMTGVGMTGTRMTGR